MNRITPYPLWIGHAGDGRAFQNLFDEGIKVIVQLALEEPPLNLPRELVYLRFPLLDGGGNSPNMLGLAVCNVAELIRQATPALVCCGAGMSRSPAIAAAALSVVESVTIEKCLQRVIQMHPADVSAAFWRQLCEATRAAGWQ
ncbi:MAG: dual specificity protein phosphatase family protein [Pirellulales bacterium]|nr:dual specificity protein phosphatase family protein [Pirellulales bacterium]